jgi:hypothetical protein
MLRLMARNPYYYLRHLFTELPKATSLTKSTTIMSCKEALPGM